jgi:ferric enterobactin receptor
MKKLAILLLVILSINCQAQNIKGLVISQKDTTPVQFGNVALLHLPDSSIISGVITLTNGEYSFENVKPGKYLVKASYVGLATNHTNVEVKSGDGDIKAETIYLSESTQALEEVTVVGQRLKGKEMVDRTVYEVPELVAKSSSNGYDILKKIPQVQVDFQNNVTLNGSNNFIIQVDGKQRDKEFLAKLMPSDIKSIEIISNPSGKYEGNIDGVINIILKKEARFGLSGSASSYFKPFKKPTAVVSGSLEYGMGNISFYITAFSFIQKLSINSNTLDRFKGRDSSNYMNGLGDLGVGSTSVNTGFDYYVNDFNTVSVNVNYKPIGQTTDMDNGSNLSKGGSVQNIMQALTNTSTHSDEGSVSLFYKKTFKKAIQEFTIENTYYLFKSKDNKDFINSFYSVNYQDTLNSFQQLEDNLNKRNYFSSKLNYVQPIGLTTKLEVGYQFYLQNMDFDYSSNLAGMSNQFEYKEVRNSVYGGVTFNLKKFGFQSNIRMENSDNDINSGQKNSYYCWLPSANLQYKFSPSHNVKLTYNRRINRPGVYDLNPFRKINANLSWSEGNANLKPEYRNRMQFTYTANFGKNYCSPYVYYEIITDKIGIRNTEITATNGTTTMLTSPGNLLTGNEKGGGVNAMLWFININARFFKGHFDEFKGATPAQSIKARDYSSYSINGYAYLQYPKKAKVTEFFFYNFNGVNINSQSRTYSMPIYGFGAQKESGNHSFGFVYLLPFYSNIEFSKTITETDYLYTDSRVGFNVSWFIQFMYTYKFNKGKSVKKVNRKVDIESDSKSDGIGK